MLNVVYSSPPLTHSIRDYNVNTRRINSKAKFYDCMPTMRLLDASAFTWHPLYAMFLNSYVIIAVNFPAFPLCIKISIVSKVSITWKKNKHSLFFNPFPVSLNPLRRVVFILALSISPAVLFMTSIVSSQQTEITFRMILCLYSARRPVLLDLWRTCLVMNWSKYKVLFLKSVLFISVEYLILIYVRGIDGTHRSKLHICI